MQHHTMLCALSFPFGVRRANPAGLQRQARDHGNSNKKSNADRAAVSFCFRRIREWQRVLPRATTPIQVRNRRSGTSVPKAAPNAQDLDVDRDTESFKNRRFLRRGASWRGRDLLR
jgi:hypothetical protein